MRSTRLALLGGLLLTIAVAVACNAPGNDPPIARTATPVSFVTASATVSVTAGTGSGSSSPVSPVSPGSPGVVPPAVPTAAPGPDAPVTGTPGPLVTATAIPISESPTVQPGRTLVLAPIESVQMVSTKSVPAQYVLTVGSGLPDGCARYAGASVEYRDTQIIVKVYNSAPAAPVPCTAIYGYTTHNVPLGALQPGVVYQVQVNDRTVDLLAP